MDRCAAECKEAAGAFMLNAMSRERLAGNLQGAIQILLQMVLLSKLDEYRRRISVRADKYLLIQMIQLVGIAPKMSFATAR